MRAEFEIPDLSGECFSNSWIYRQIPESISQLFERAVGGLLLINPSLVMEPPMITELPLPSGPGQSEGHPAYDPEGAFTSVKLVDILQNVQSIVLRQQSVAVIVSAWDTVEESDEKKLTPEQWLNKHLPLLTQYLRSNVEWLRYKIFGVSAQGGDLRNPTIRKNLLAISRPKMRIRILEEGCEVSHDITRPIRWVVGSDSRQ